MDLGLPVPFMRTPLDSFVSFSWISFANEFKKTKTCISPICHILKRKGSLAHWSLIRSTNPRISQERATLVSRGGISFSFFKPSPSFLPSALIANDLQPEFVSLHSPMLLPVVSGHIAFSKCLRNWVKFLLFLLGKSFNAEKQGEKFWRDT